jgi:hypothetical protein
LTLGLALGCSLAAARVEAGPVSRDKQGETVRHAARNRGEQMRELHQSLRGAEPATGLGRALTVALSQAEKASAETQTDARYRVGVSKALGIVLDFSRRSQPFGVREVRPDGGATWSGVVRSPGASALRLHFSPFDLPEGAELYVYGPEQQAFGPYTGRGEVDDGMLWTNNVWGEEVRLQLRLPAHARASSWPPPATWAGLSRSRWRARTSAPATPLVS